MIRASFLQRSPFLLLAAALVTLAVFFAPGGQPARAQTPSAPDTYQMQRMHLGFYLWWGESSGATGYDIQTRSQSGVDWGDWEDVAYSGMTQPAIVTGLTHGTKYQWRIRATAGSQQSAWSTPAGDSRDTRTASRFGTDKPNPPILRSATPGPGQVMLRWEAGPARSGVNVNGYRISYRWEDTQAVLRTERTGLLGTGVTSYAVTGLSAGVQYDFWLHPLVGESIGAGSNVLQAVPQMGSGPVGDRGRCNHADSTPPGLPQITSVRPDDHGITVRWDSPAYGRQWSGRKDMITNFIIRTSATDGSHDQTGSVTAESYEPASYTHPIRGLSPATEYRIEITARTITACYSGPSAIEVSTTSSGGQRGSSLGVVHRSEAQHAPRVVSALDDVSGLEVGATREVSLAGAFADADGDGLTVGAASGDEAVATVEVAADHSALTLTGVAVGEATVTVTARDADGNSVSEAFEVSVVEAPGTDEPETSAVVAYYDANGNGAIDMAEYIQALRDRAAGRLSAAEWEEILDAWLASAYGS